MEHSVTAGEMEVLLKASGFVGMNMFHREELFGGKKGVPCEVDGVIVSL